MNKILFSLLFLLLPVSVFSIDIKEAILGCYSGAETGFLPKRRPFASPEYAKLVVYRGGRFFLHTLNKRTNKFVDIKGKYTVNGTSITFYYPLNPKETFHVSVTHGAVDFLTYYALTFSRNGIACD